MKPGKVRGFTALSQDDEVSLHFEFIHGLDEISMAKLGGDVTDAGRKRSGLGFDQDGATSLLRKLCLLLVQGSEFRKQIVPRVHVEIATEIHWCARDVAATENVQQLDRCRCSKGYPGGIVANALRIDGSVYEREEFRHRRSPS